MIDSAKDFSYPCYYMVGKNTDENRAASIKWFGNPTPEQQSDKPTKIDIKSHMKKWYDKYAGKFANGDIFWQMFWKEREELELLSKDK